MREVDQQHADDGRGREKNNRRDQPGKIFAYDQHLATHRTQKVEMQAAVDDVATEQVHKYPGAAEEDHGAQNEPTVKNGKDHVVLSEVVPLASGRREGSKQDQRDYRQQRQQVEQNRSSAEKVLLCLEAEDSANLTEPERPRQWCLANVLTR